MRLFNDKVQKQLQDILTELKDEVRLLYFTQEFECRTCQEGRQFVEEFAELSDKINVSVFEFVKNKKEAEKYEVDKIPAIVLLDKNDKDFGIRFYGIPGGYEINSFIAALREVSGNGEELPNEILERIRAFDKETHIQVFITMTCPYCPGAVVTAHRLAFENEHISADMVDATVFPDLSNKYGVMGVPKTVIDGKKDLVGAHPITAVLDAIEQN